MGKLDLFSLGKSYKEQRYDTIQNMRLLCALILLHLALGDATTQTEVDFTQSLNQANLPLLQSVEKRVDGRYPFTLTSNFAWTKFNDMDISFDLPYDQRVSFTYNIGLTSGPYCYFLSKMEINGEEDRLFRAQSNNSDYPSVFRFGEVFLKAGTYRIVVSYKTNCNGHVIDPTKDYMAAVFRVLYHKVKSA